MTYIEFAWMHCGIVPPGKRPCIICNQLFPLTKEEPGGRIVCGRASCKEKLAIAFGTKENSCLHTVAV